MALRDMIDKARRQRKRAESLDKAKKVGVGLGIGAAVGGILGVLFAPKAGKETREDIAQAASEAAKNIRENA